MRPLVGDGSQAGPGSEASARGLETHHHHHTSTTTTTTTHPPSPHIHHHHTSTITITTTTTTLQSEQQTLAGKQQHQLTLREPINVLNSFKCMH